MKVEIITPGTAMWLEYFAKLTDYVNNSATARIYHLPVTCEIIQKEFGHQCYYLVAIDNDSICGVLPLIRQKSLLFGDHFISLPYFNYAGADGVNVRVENILLESAKKLFSTTSASDIELRETRPRDGFIALDHKVTMILELVDENTIWQKLGSKMRSQIKRPIQENIEYVCGREELLDEFYTVFSRNMRDLGTPVYQKSFFQSILTGYSNMAQIHLVRIRNQPVGAAIVFSFKSIAEIPWASTIREYNKYSVNMYMYWEIIKSCIKSQCKQFDFGRTSKDSGTYKFKKQWNTNPLQLYWNYHLAPGSKVPMNNPKNTKFSLAINIWKKLPLFVAERVGPILARNLP